MAPEQLKSIDQQDHHLIVARNNNCNEWQYRGVASRPRKLLNCVQESQYLSISKRISVLFQ